MMDWSEAKARVRPLVMEVRTHIARGTGFLLHRTARNLVVATAWHVIDDLLYVEDKHRRRITLIGSDKNYSAVADVVGVVRLGDEKAHVGLVWVGPPFSQKAINDALHTLAKSAIRYGHIDFSGGGGVVHIDGDPSNLLRAPLLEILTLDQLNREAKIGLMGYPSKPPKDVAIGDTVFFDSFISGLSKPNSFFIDWSTRDGPTQKGISGGPVFTEAGQLAGLVSSYAPEYQAIRVVNAPALPWID
jgi:hypothetical protein